MIGKEITLALPLLIEISGFIVCAIKSTQAVIGKDESLRNVRKLSESFITASSYLIIMQSDVKCKR